VSDVLSRMLAHQAFYPKHKFGPLHPEERDQLITFVAGVTDERDLFDKMLAQACMNLATGRETRWMPYPGQWPNVDKSLGEIADDWRALLVQQVTHQLEEPE
jgi:hypothetical protein